MGHEQIKGKIEQAAGKVTEVAGNLTENVRLQSEGAFEQVTGKTREVVSNVAEASKDFALNARDAASELVDTIKGNLKGKDMRLVPIILGAVAAVGVAALVLRRPRRRR